ncbi:MAG: hypothetical protein HQM15_00105 [Deltaproteobacteria bacterium]|nr:hypothetical protein [Deltaproteobacteria bacterium]
MSARVNFFKEDNSALSYEKMVWVSVLFLVIFVLFYVVQSQRAQNFSQELSDLSLQIEGIKKTQGINVGGNSLSPVETVTLIMLNEPDWSDAMRAISGSLSESIWLENIQASTSASASAKTAVDNKNGAKPAVTAVVASAAPEILIEGTTYQSRLLPGFADRLRSFNAFSQVNLKSGGATSKELNAPQKFKITGQLKTP